MGDASTTGSGGLQADLESILGRSQGRRDPLASAVPDERPAAPVIVLLPRDVPRRPQRPLWVVPAIACASIAVVAVGAVAIVRSTSSRDGAAAPVPTAAAPVATTASARPATPTAPAPTTPVEVKAATPATPTTLEPRSAVFAGGKVYLRGTVPDEATARTLVERAGTVVGPQNVVEEYVVDPAAPRVNSAPLRVADTVQFAPGSATVAPQFRGLLDLGVALMLQYPKVEVTVLGHTDSAGDEVVNQALSQRRVDAVLAYLVRAGVDAGRVTGVAKGEAQPIAGNDTAEGRRLNRRIEFVITGLLG